LNYDGEIVIGTKVDTEGLEKGIDDVENLLKDGKVFKRVGKDEMGNALVDGISVAIKESSTELSKEVINAFSALELKKKMNVVSEEEYYKELEKLRDNYLEKGTADWWKYTVEIVRYENEVVENQKKNIEKLTEEISKNIEDKFSDVAQNVDTVMKKSVSEYESKIKAINKNEEKMKDKLSSYGGIYATATFKTGDKEKSYLEDGVWKRKSPDITIVDVNDLKGEIKVLNEYESVLKSIFENKNISKEFFDSFKNLGVEDGIKIAKSILSLSDDAQKEYMSLWNSKNDAADSVSSFMYNEDRILAKNELSSKLKEAFGSVDETFLSEEGQKWASSFGDSFKDKISETMDSVKSIISEKISEIEYSINLDTEKNGNTLVYNLYGAGESVSEKLKSAKAFSELEKLRGGY